MTRHYNIAKRIRSLAAVIPSIAIAAGISSCQDETSPVGGALATGEVQIALDSLVWDGTRQTIHRGETEQSVECPKIEYSTIFDKKIDTRSTTNLLGRISVPEYGNLNCSFVSRMMSVSKLSIPDSIPIEQVDSMKLILSIPQGAFTGDSLAPQQLKVYKLTNSLPTDITNEFDPLKDNLYANSDSVMGTSSFTLSSLSMKDSIYSSSSYVYIDIPISRDWAQQIVKAYRSEESKSMFEWPQEFEKFFHGIYVAPSFGRGCVANISNSDFVIFYNYKVTESTTDADGVTTDEVKTKVGATGVFSSSPIVLSSNNVTYEPSDYLHQLASDGEALLTTPGGYRVEFKFPGQELLDIYNNSQSKLTVISDLNFSLPAEEITNDYGVTPPPYLLMIKKSKVDEFFANNSLPDNKDSFYATYNPTEKRYVFSSMRNYMTDLVENGATDENTDFIIMPVDLTFETQENSSSSYYSYYYYYYGYGANTSTTSYLTKCMPYILKPTMCRLNFDKAQTVFTYSLLQLH